MFAKLTNLINYLQGINEHSDCNTIFVTNEDEGSKLLRQPAEKGTQVVIALPVAEISGDCQINIGNMSFIIFVVDKSRSATSNAEDVVNESLQLLSKLNAITDVALNDIAGLGHTSLSELLAGFELVGCEIAPEANIFGGWFGWSATITLRG